MSQSHLPDDSWQRLAPVIDDALDRNAVLLRFAEGRSHREVGRALGLSEEAAKKRLPAGAGKTPKLAQRCRCWCFGPGARGAAGRTTLCGSTSGIGSERVGGGDGDLPSGRRRCAGSRSPTRVGVDSRARGGGTSRGRRRAPVAVVGGAALGADAAARSGPRGQSTPSRRPSGQRPGPSTVSSLFRLTVQISDASWREPRQDRERIGSMRRLRLGLTDRQGRWRSAVVSKQRPRFVFQFEHPDFVTGSLAIDRRSEDSTMLRQLQSHQAETILEPGFAITGSVVDAQGNVVVGARIAEDWSGPGVTSETDGSFVVRRQPRGVHTLTASAEGFTPQSFDVVAGGQPVQVVLSRGGVMRARVLTTNGEPIPNVSVGLDNFYGLSRISWSGVTDADGRVAWNGVTRGGDCNNSAKPPFAAARQASWS